MRHLNRNMCENKSTPKREKSFHKSFLEFWRNAGNMQQQENKQMRLKSLASVIQSTQHAFFLVYLLFHSFLSIPLCISVTNLPKILKKKTVGVSINRLVVCLFTKWWCMRPIRKRSALLWFSLISPPHAGKTHNENSVIGSHCVDIFLESHGKYLFSAVFLLRILFIYCKWCMEFFFYRLAPSAVWMYCQ